MTCGRRREWPKGLGVSRVRLVCCRLHSLFFLRLVYFPPIFPPYCPMKNIVPQAMPHWLRHAQW